MKLTFDITEEELPIFLAESDEQLQILDEGLVQLEREEEDAELLQALFRAAHTLKGSAGMISHKRMVDLTHALETALDGLRKHTLEVSSELMDTCLQAVDALRMLTGEVAGGESALVDITPLVARFSVLNASSSKQPSPQDGAQKDAQPAAERGVSGDNRAILTVHAGISPDSIASAARAFQLMLALQELGEIVSMEPSQAQIETAAPVFEFRAQFIPSQPFCPELLAEIKKTLSTISEITISEITISEITISEIMISEIEQLTISLNKDHPEPATQNQHETEGPLLSERSRGRPGEKTVRTSVERLDNLMNLVGELITDRNRLNLIRSELEARFRGDEQVDALTGTITHIGRITDQLQAEVMGIRMLPISNVFNKFPRMVRDLARKAGKQIDLVMRGEDTELDRSVIEEISDPLIHLLRNSVDHGIENPEERLAAGKPERGVILLTARHEQGRIIITVEDNGRGINLDAVKARAVDKEQISKSEAETMTDEDAIDLIFVSGLSTAKVVSDVSGRGVGMDIVRNNLERLNGNILVETWPGKGTQFQIILPLTLAIVPTLLVRIGVGTFAIPLVTVTETLRVPISDIQTVNGKPVLLFRDHVLPVIRLSEIFNLHANGNGFHHSQNEYVVIVRSGKSQIGLIVDALVGEQEVVVKSLSTVLGEITGISSAAILGDGQVALIIDVQGLFKLALSHPTGSGNKKVIRD